MRAWRAAGYLGNGQPTGRVIDDLAQNQAPPQVSSATDMNAGASVAGVLLLKGWFHVAAAASRSGSMLA